MLGNKGFYSARMFTGRDRRLVLQDVGLPKWTPWHCAGCSSRLPTTRKSLTWMALRFAPGTGPGFRILQGVSMGKEAGLAGKPD